MNFNRDGSEAEGGVLWKFWGHRRDRSEPSPTLGVMTIVQNVNRQIGLRHSIPLRCHLSTRTQKMPPVKAKPASKAACGPVNTYFDVKGSVRRASMSTKAANAPA